MTRAAERYRTLEARLLSRPPEDVADRLIEDLAEAWAGMTAEEREGQRVHHRARGSEHG